MAPSKRERRSAGGRPLSGERRGTTYPLLYRKVDGLCTTSAILAMDLGQLARRHDDRGLTVAALSAVDVAIGVHRFMARLVDGQVAP